MEEGGVSGYPFGIPPSSIYRFRFPIWYTTLFHLPFQVTHLVYHPLPFNVSGYPFGIGKWKRVVYQMGNLNRKMEEGGTI
jgi:hypothetical protein